MIITIVRIVMCIGDVALVVTTGYLWLHWLNVFSIALMIGVWWTWYKTGAWSPWKDLWYQLRG